MRTVVIGVLASLLALPAYGQMSRQKQCEMQAGEPSNPTYESVLKDCMGNRGLSTAERRRQAARTEARREAARDDARAEARREAARDDARAEARKEARREAARDKARREAARRDARNAASGGSR